MELQRRDSRSGRMSLLPPLNPLMRLTKKQGYPL
nr:MAG TPA: hypothetical protein [Caudoviricetes sp.]